MAEPIHRTTALATRMGLVALVLLVVGLAPAVARAQNHVTVAAHDLGSGDPLTQFTYIVNEDNTADPGDPDPLKRPSTEPTPSHSKLVAEGDQDHPTSDLPDGKYLISIRSPHHKLWGKHVSLPADNGTVDVGLKSGPFPLGKIRVFVFNDSLYTNSQPDAAEPGLKGFHVTLEEQTNSQVTVDYNNDPLCGGDCVTDDQGGVTIDNLGPATYFVYVTPPDEPCGNGGTWVQTTTFDGGFGVQAGVEEGSDGTGAPGEQTFEPPNVRTAYWFGFVCTDTNTFPSSATASVSGRALNWVGWPPFDELVADANEPVRNAYVALSDSTSDVTRYVGQADGDGNFQIPNVPAGTYNLSIWDEQLSYIMRFVPVTVTPGQQLDLGEIGVSRWFGWLGGYVYLDENNNGVRDCTDAYDPTTCEPPVANTDMDERWRDGSIKDATTTDSTGYYEYPQAEGGPLGKWFINEQGFARLSAFPGPSVHNELDPSQVTPLPTDEGGGLLQNQLLTEGHRAWVDWGKRRYGDEPGQIVGITYFATTRNEFEAYKQNHEDYEPAIPDVQVNLEGLGPDKKANTPDDVVLNEYITDHWSQPQSCDMSDRLGNDLSGSLNSLIGDRCLEVPINGEESKDGAFDGGYAFADYCPEAVGGFGHFDDNGDTVCKDGSGPVPLVAGSYVTHAIMPQDPNDDRPCNPVNSDGFKNITGPDGAAGGTGCLYRPVREEDVNVDLGAEFEPAIPPPPCTGDAHTIDQSTLTERSPYFGSNPSPKPLCDKRLVVLANKQNANADFHMMTDQPNGIDVEEPGRLIGLVSDDINFDRDQKSIWFGEPRPVGDIPIGIRDYSGRLLLTTKTDNNGTYTALLPSTETFNCPIPQGPCPGMYIVTVNDPGDLGHPNPNFNPDYLTARMAWDIWPGQTDQLDTPLDPISGIGCDLSLTTPELLQVSKVNVDATDTTAASRRVTIQGDFFGTTPGTVTLSDPRGQSRTLGPAVSANPTVANGGVVSWANRQIVIQVPATSTSFAPGPKQLTIRTPGTSGQDSVNGLTLHVRGTGYNPPLTPVQAPTVAHAIQNAVDAAPVVTSGNPAPILVLRPGTYHENVIMTKRVQLQGLGPGGIVGAAELQQRQPDDPRFNTLGTTIDGRFFNDAQVHQDWVQNRDSLMPIADVDASTRPLLGGGAIVVAGKTSSTFTTSGTTAVLNPARIDGIGLITAKGDGAGGIELQSNAQNTQITNNVVANDSGFWVGGIGVGQPGFNAHNTAVAIRNNRVLGSGGLTKAGAIGIFNGSNNYDVQSNMLCANYGIEYNTAGGIYHYGQSTGGKIRDNQLIWNDSIGSGGGIAIEHDIPAGGGAGSGSGTVDVDRNLIEGNYSAKDGGGLFVSDAHNDRINVRNNMFADNGAAAIGGAVKLEDSVNVAFINNTVANNVSTASAVGSDSTPHSAGLAAEANDPQVQAILPASAPRFSNPSAFFNNIFWDNNAFTLSSSGPGATLVDQGFIDLEIHGGAASNTFTPRYTLLTANGETRGDGTTTPLPGGQANIFGVDPSFVAPFTLELAVIGSRQDPQTAAVTISGAEPPAEQAAVSNYHLSPFSPAIDRGAGYHNYPATRTSASILAPCSVMASPQPFGGDFDRQSRPQLRSLRVLTPWDLGADEVPGLNIPLLPWGCGGTT